MNTLTVIERENQRVMTTAVLAEEYGTTTEVITKNFNRNKDRYTEGKHFYCVEGEQLKEFRATGQIDFLPSNINKLYLWTEKGAFLHAKSLNTDRAWEVYDNLVESYFKKTTDLFENILGRLSPELKAIFAHDARLQAQDEKLEVVETRVDKLENTMVVDHGQGKDLQSTAAARVMAILLGKNSKAYKNKSLSGRTFTAIWHDYKDYFNINSYHNTPVARFEEAKEYLKNWMPDNNLQLEINMINRGEI